MKLNIGLKRGGGAIIAKTLVFYLILVLCFWTASHIFNQLGIEITAWLATVLLMMNVRPRINDLKERLMNKG